MQMLNCMHSQLRATQINVRLALGFLKHCKYLEGPPLPLGRSEMFKGAGLETHCLDNVDKNCEGLLKISFRKSNEINSFYYFMELEKQPEVFCFFLLRISCH